MSIITNNPITYFKGLIDIPFDNKDTSEFEANYLDVYEKEILTRFLGYTLYKEFTEALNAGSPAQKWVDLLEGAEYTVTVDGIDYTVLWNGLQNSDKISLITDWVYFRWLQENNEQLTGLGVSSANKENATDYDPNFKLVQAHNRCVSLAGNEDNDELAPTLYNFIYNNEANYDKWVFTELETINVLGI
jgi:hypothetical protein